MALTASQLAERDMNKAVQAVDKATGKVEKARAKFSIADEGLVQALAELDAAVKIADYRAINPALEDEPVAISA